MSQTAASSATELCCAPGLVWVRDADRVWVVDPQSGQSWALRGIEAALWDWLVMGYSYARLVRFCSLVLGLAQEAAEQQTRRLLQRWQVEGLLRRKGRQLL